MQISSYLNEVLTTFQRPNTDDNEMKTFEGCALCIIYKVEDDINGITWIMKPLLEPVLALVKPSAPTTEPKPLGAPKGNITSVHVVHKNKFERCLELVINNVESLEKFKPRLFSNVRDVCAALSSQALPNLKKTFQKSEKGLNITQFTKVIFNQLANTHPSVMEESEAASTVALIQEMFQQIGRLDRWLTKRIMLFFSYVYVMCYIFVLLCQVCVSYCLAAATATATDVVPTILQPT